MRIKSFPFILSVFILSASLLCSCSFFGSSFRSENSQESHYPVESSKGVDNFFESPLLHAELNIKEIENYDVINAAWKDENSIFFIAQNGPEDKNEDIVWDDYPVKVYHYDQSQKKLRKIYEYVSECFYPYLYIQVQDDGSVALKTVSGFFLLSGEDFSHVKEIKMPSNLYHVNYNLSYDNKKIAVAHYDTKILEVWDSESFDVLHSAQITDSSYIQAPTWTTDSEFLLLFAPKHEFVDVVYTYSLSEKEIKKFDFSQYLVEYDNEAFLAEAGHSVYRMDISDMESGGVAMLFEKHDLQTNTSTFWTHEVPMMPYCKSISEKGYLVAHAYKSEHFIYIGDLDSKRIVTTESFSSGGAKYPPLWNRAQEKAILLITAGNRGDVKETIWKSTIVDCKQVLEN